MGMSNQIDDLFRKKLEGHSVEPGPLTWSRISARFIKKNRILIGYRAAAAIALMALHFGCMTMHAMLPLQTLPK